MSETDDEERRRRKELKQKRREKKKRRAERLLQQETTQQEQLPGPSRLVQQTETEEEARSRRKREKKEAKRLRKHKEASALGQKAVSVAGSPVKKSADASSPTKKTAIVETAPSTPKDPKEGKSRKRKKRPTEDVSRNPQSTAETAVETLSAPFHPLQSEVDIEQQGSLRKKARLNAGQSKSKAPRASVQALIDQAIAKPGSGSERQEGEGGESSRRERNARQTSPSQSASQSTKTKEGTLEDALHLTHEEMLVDRLYHSNQLKWLQEERGLKVKSGKFSEWEKERIQGAISAFKSEHGLSDEDFILWLFGDRKGQEEQNLYTTFWKSVTASLVDRPNRAVRIAVRRNLQPDTLQGAWSDAENERLRSAVGANGRNWSAVAKAVGTRTAEDCRLRWRNYAPEIEAKKVKGRFGEDDRERLTAAVQKVCEKNGHDPMSPDSKIPWKRVAEEMGNERTPAHCLIKWQSMLKEANGRYDANKWKWKLIDSKIFTDRLEKETAALERDDFTEVRLSSLRSPSWLMEPTLMLHKWKSLVKKYVSPTADYKTNFKSNLASIKYGLDKVQNEKAARKRSQKQDEDLIDTDEEA